MHVKEFVLERLTYNFYFKLKIIYYFYFNKLLELQLTFHDIQS